MSEQDLINQAIEALGIDVPVARSRVLNDRVELYLYGGSGQPVTWSPEDPGPAPPVKANFSEIPGIGRATRDALHESGISTWIGLKRASDQRLLQVVNPRQLINIRSHFAKG